MFKKISERALIQRINRQLTKENKCLRTTREDSQWFSDTGRYFIVSADGLITSADVDIEELGREMKVLNPYEILETRKEKKS